MLTITHRQKKDSYTEQRTENTSKRKKLGKQVTELVTGQ